MYQIIYLLSPLDPRHIHYFVFQYLSKCENYYCGSLTYSEMFLCGIKSLAVSMHTHTSSHTSIKIDAGFEERGDSSTQSLPPLPLIIDHMFSARKTFG